jgi:uncharacterized protein YfaS (alpha-2-macroglobulin family)
MLNRWARRGGNLTPGGYYQGGLNQGALNLPGISYSGIQHQISTNYINIFVRDQSDPLNSQGYGSPQDGYRRHPWAAFRPGYVMNYSTEVELEEPGVYVVVAEGDHGTSSKVAFLYSDLESVIRRDGRTLHVQAVSRKDGKPLGDVAVDSYWITSRSSFATQAREESRRTGPGGFLKIKVPKCQQSWLVLNRRGHYQFLVGSGSDISRGDQDQVLIHLTTDRQVYKPGETIQFRGVARQLKVGDRLAVLSGKKVEVHLGWDGRVKTEATLSKLGTFSGKLELPRDQRTGNFRLQASVAGLGGAGNLSVEVLAYRKPEHEVLVKATEPWVVQGEEAEIKLHGRFTVGGNLSGAKVRWQIRPQAPSASSRGATVSGRGEGGGWRWREEDRSGGPNLSGQGVLDGRGRLTVPIQLPVLSHDYSVKLQATVVSPDGREVHGSTSFYAPRSLVVLGMKSTMSLVEENEPWVVLARSLDLEGKNQNAVVELTLQRRRWVRTSRKGGGHSWHEKIDPIKTWSETIPASGKAQWEIPMPLAGNIELIGKTKDQAGRETSSKITTYRYGEDAPWWRWDRLELSADQLSYAPGETARVLLRCPLEKGVAWWSLEGAGLQRRGQVKVAGFNAKIEVALSARDLPEATLHVEVMKHGQRLQKDLKLEVPSTRKQAKVILETDARVYQPGDEVSVKVYARSDKGKPLAGEFCLAVVDQALDQVATDHTPLPYETFYGTRANRVLGFGGYGHGMYEMKEMAFGGGRGMAMDGLMALGAAPIRKAARAPAPMMSAAAPGGGGGGGIKMRSEFRDVAYWVASVQTDPSGEGQVRFKLPDDLARWKLVAYWVDGETRVAKSVHKVTARKDLMVRLGLPRFLTTGDHIVIKSSVQNVTDKDRSGSLTFKTQGAAPVPLGRRDLDSLGIREDARTGWLLGPSGPLKRAPDKYQLTVGAQSHAAVDFPIYVHGYPASGEMTFESIFNSRGQGDGLRKSIPVVPFARRRTEVTVHRVKKTETRIPIKSRKGTFLQATEVAVDLMLSLDQAAETNLVNDLNHLIGYRYGCTEQTLSRFVPLASAYAGLGEKWLRLAGVNRAGELEAILQKGVDRLRVLRNGQGWGWSPGDQASSSVTAYVISRIYRLPEPYRGRLIKELKLHSAVNWLKNLYTSNSKAALDREERENDHYRLLSVYRSFEALALAGVSLPVPRLAKVKALRDDPRFWTCYGTAVLALGNEKLAAKARSELERLSIGDKAFHSWRHRGSPYSWYADDTETSALVLEFFQRLEATGSEIPREYRTGLRWLALGPGSSGYRSTKARAVSVAVAVTHLEQAPPKGRKGPIQVTVKAGKSQKRIISPDPRAPRSRVLVKAPELVRARQVVTLVKPGSGQLMARLETTRFEKGPFRAEDHGFGVASHLESGPAEKSNLSIRASGSGDGETFTSHRSFRRVVEFTVPESRRYALLEVPLISGAEVPVKGESRPALWRQSNNGKWYRNWQQVDVLDDRVVFYWRYLSPGSYRAEVTMTPEIAGFHNMLPARIFLMYFPHVEGSSGSHRVKIRRAKE